MPGDTMTPLGGRANVRFAAGPLIDHHCHGVVSRALDRVGFEGLLNEAPGSSALGTSTFDSMVGLAVRRWCAPVLDLPPLAPAEEYVARRLELGSADVNRRFVAGAGIAEFLVDTGFVPEPISGPAELAGLADGTGHEIVRLEALAETVLRECGAAAEFPDLFLHALRTTSAIGAKSIAAYRTGLGLTAGKPSEGELVAALNDVPVGADGSYRIAHPVVHCWLAWSAIEAGLPLQFHVGYGDRDVDLLDCDPLRLTAFLRASEERGVPVLLLHNYPFHRNAAYLAQVFDHVFMDLGLATHNAGALSPTLLRETLELVPFGKLLFSSDAFGLSELYYLGALLFRRGLSQVLADLIDSGDMTSADADHIATLVGSANARRVYRLEVADGAGPAGWV